MRTAVLCTMLLLAGCAGPDQSPPSTPSPIPTAEDSKEFLFVCSDGRSQKSLCKESLSSLTSSFQNPVIALGPSEGQISLIHEVVSYPGPAGDFRPHLMVRQSAEAGKQWKTILVPGQATGGPTSNPSEFGAQIAYDGSSKLHLVAQTDRDVLVSPRPCCYGNFLYWQIEGERVTQPQSFGDKNRDNAWLSIVGLNSSAIAFWASSRDGGEFETHFVELQGKIVREGRLPGCALAGRPIIARQILLPCRETDEGLSPVSLFKLNLQNFTASLLGPVPLEASWIFLASNGAEVVAMSGEAIGGCQFPILASQNGGHDWTTLISGLGAKIGTPAGPCRVTGVDVDRWGQIHVLTSAADPNQMPGTPNGWGYWVTREQPVRYALVNSSGEVLLKAELTPRTAAGDGPPESLAPFFSTATSSVDAFDARVGVTWWHEKGIHWTRLEAAG